MPSIFYGLCMRVPISVYSCFCVAVLIKATIKASKQTNSNDINNKSDCSCSLSSYFIDIFTFSSLKKKKKRCKMWFPEHKTLLHLHTFLSTLKLCFLLKFFGGGREWWGEEGGGGLKLWVVENVFFLYNTLYKIQGPSGMLRMFFIK